MNYRFSMVSYEAGSRESGASHRQMGCDTSPLPGYWRESFLFTGVNLFVCRDLTGPRALTIRESRVSENQPFTPVNVLIGSGLVYGHSDRNEV